MASYLHLLERLVCLFWRYSKTLRKQTRILRNTLAYIFYVPVKQTGISLIKGNIVTNINLQSIYSGLKFTLEQTTKA